MVLTGSCSNFPKVLKRRDVLLLGTAAVASVESEGIPESDSDYDEVDDILDENAETTKDKCVEFLHSHGLDVDGRHISKNNSVFKTSDEAASYTPIVVDHSPCEIPSIVLYDYFGGHTCMEMNAVAGDQVNLLAEEYQVRSVVDTSKNQKYVRLPLKWSLVRWVKPRPQLTPVGLIPSSWIVPKKIYEDHPDLFMDPSWYLGICDPNAAIDYLFFDTSLLQTGVFTIFSPFFANLSELDHRPYQLAVLEERTETEQAEFQQRWSQQGPPTTFAEQLELEAKLKQRKIDELKEKRSGTLDVMRQQKKKKTGSTTNTVQPDAGKMKEARIKYKVKLFTITRSYLGDYELFGTRYSSLYDLVYRLSHSESELPFRLNYIKRKRPSDYKVFRTACHAPLHKMPHPDYRALPMYCEQWAAKYYSQVIEPQTMEKFVNFATRTILNPSIELHKTIANKLKMTESDQTAAKEAVERYVAKKGAPQPNNTLPPESLVLSTGKLSLKMENLTYDITKPLGKGQFGCVYIGEIKVDDVKHKVAIKTQKLFDIEKEDKFPFLNEVETLMMTSHPNVVTFFGYSIDVLEKSALLVFELLSEGSLDKFCAKINHELSTFEVIDFLIQISRGVGHLHTREPTIVHADLAARNVLVKEHPTDKTRMILKITDLGLSQNAPIDAHLAYKNPQKIPFKWLPPEVLKGQQVSWTTDVWSFGIVAHELYGIGEPYGIMGPDKLIQYFEDGVRFERQPRMSHFIYDVVLKCQRFAPYERPTMSELEHILSSFLLEYDCDHIEAIRERKYLEEILEAEFKPSPGSA